MGPQSVSLFVCVSTDVATPSCCCCFTCMSSSHQLLQYINPASPPVSVRSFHHPRWWLGSRANLRLLVFLCANLVRPRAPDSPSPANRLTQLISHLPTCSLSTAILSSSSPPAFNLWSSNFPSPPFCHHFTQSSSEFHTFPECVCCVLGPFVTELNSCHHYSRTHDVLILFYKRECAAASQ